MIVKRRKIKWQNVLFLMKKLEKLFLTIPAWKVGDPAVPMCILPEFPLLETPKDMGLDQILHSY